MPAFNTIPRKKDARHGPNVLSLTPYKEGRWHQHAYSYWPAGNQDDSVFVFMRGYPNTSRPVYVSFNADSFVAGKRKWFWQTIPAGSGAYPDVGTGVWHRTDPRVFYCAVDRNLVSYSLDTGLYTVIKNFDTEMGSTGRLYHLSLSDDGNIFGALHTNTGFTPLGHLVYRLSDDTVTEFTATTDIDEVQIDKSGQYLWWRKEDQTDGCAVLKVSDSTVTHLTYGTPNFATGHYVTGTDVVVGYDDGGGNNRITKRTLSSPASVTELLDIGADFSQDMHFSLSGPDEDWVLVTMGDNANGITGTNPWNNHIFFLKMDGSGTIRYQHPTRNVGPDEPSASLSRSGRFICWTSNDGLPSCMRVYIGKVLA